MYIVRVDIRVKPDCLDRFITASLDNANSSRKEPGVIRFDIFQQTMDPTVFEFIEAYHTEEDALRHRDTQHFHRWRETAEPMMIEPRTRTVLKNVSPQDSNY